MLVGLLESYEGRTTVLGREVTDWEGSYYDRVGISAESPNHYLQLTGRENLELLAALHAEPTRGPMEMPDCLGLADAANRRVKAYSKVMGMRLNLARALLHDPELYFLDEPTTGLDPANARNVREIIDSLRAEDATVVLTTHDMTVADELCDRVAFIVDGAIPVVDRPKALKLAHGTPSVRVEYRDDGRKTREFPIDGLGENPAFRRLLRTQSIETFHTTEATLEDVFIAVTGRELT